MKPTKEQIVAALTTNVCTVTFTKVNGEIRTMPCTLRSDLIPPKPIVAEARQSESVRKENEKTLSVWCTDKAAWRSFRLDSVTELQIDLGMPTVV